MRGVARLDDVAGPGAAGRRAGGRAGRRRTPGPRCPGPLSSAEALSSTRSPGCGVADHVGVGQRPHGRRRSSSAPVEAAARHTPRRPAHRRTSRSTRPGCATASRQADSHVRAAPSGSVGGALASQPEQIGEPARMSPRRPAAKTERLLNLVLVPAVHAPARCRRPRSASSCRSTAQPASDEAFDRMFERDKDELRELGIPLVTEDDRRRSSRTSPATASTSASTPCPTSPSSPTSWPCSAWPAAPGPRPAWPVRPRRRCASCRPPGVERDVDVAHRHRAAAAHHRAGLRRGQERRAAAPGRSTLRLPHRPRGGEAAPAARAAVGARVLARPLVPHRLRPRPRRAAGVPPVAASSGAGAPRRPRGSFEVPGRPRAARR